MVTLHIARLSLILHEKEKKILAQQYTITVIKTSKYVTYCYVSVVVLYFARILFLLTRVRGGSTDLYNNFNCIYC